LRRVFCLWGDLQGAAFAKTNQTQAHCKSLLFAMTGLDRLPNGMKGAPDIS